MFFLLIRAFCALITKPASAGATKLTSSHSARSAPSSSWNALLGAKSRACFSLCINTLQRSRTVCRPQIPHAAEIAAAGPRSFPPSREPQLPAQQDVALDQVLDDETQLSNVTRPVDLEVWPGRHAGLALLPALPPASEAQTSCRGFGGHCRTLRTEGASWMRQED